MKRAAPLVLCLSGCFVADTITGPIEVRDPPCPTDEEFFAEVVSATILETDCMQCHRADGFARDTRLILKGPEEPGYMEANFETVRSVAGTAVGGKSILLLKPTLQVSHGGGQRFSMDSDRYAALEELVFRFTHPDQCFGGPGATTCDEPGPHPGPSPLRPLTSTQYENTIRDLFEGTIDPSGLIPKTTIKQGFNTFVSANIVSESKAEDFLLAAEEIARRATTDLNGFLGCTQGQTEEQCVSAFVDRFGMRAYRRPLRDDERAILMSIYRLPSFDLAEKVQMIVQVALESPQFLYLDETGGTPIADDVEEISPYVIAQRLSYFFWDTMPDDELFAAAMDGSLSDPAVIRAQAERLLADPRAEKVVASFHRDWLMTYGLEQVQKDASAYPTFTPALARSMNEEIDRFVSHVVFAQNGGLTELLTSRVSFTDVLLDDVYGTSSGSTEPGDFREVALPADQRTGLLSRAAFLAKHSHAGGSAPISRGVFIIRNMLCTDLVIPPGLVAGELPQIEGSTLRERFAMHRQEPACAACHDKIDPLGFAFERYDGIGTFRNEYDNGREIDTYGHYQDLSIEFEDALDLTDRLVESSVVRDCYALQWFRYAVGRVEDPADCSVEPLQQRFRKSGGNVKDLMLGIVESDAFRYRRTGL